MMDHNGKIAVVTGGNRGIGYEVCRQLALQGHRVILTSRDGLKGELAAQGLAKAGVTVSAHPLDVSSRDSVSEFSEFVQRELGRVDILVNNAAILPDEGARVLDLDVDVFRQVVETNTFGPLLLCQILVPLMLQHDYGRIVNVSSSSAQFSSLSARNPAYRLSKVALNALTVMVAQAVQGHNILVNAASPGWVRTDMGGPNAPRSLEQGADTLVWLANLPDGGPSGQFFRDREQIPW